MRSNQERKAAYPFHTQQQEDQHGASSFLVTGAISVLLLAGNSSALKYDFVFNETSQTYNISLSGAPEHEYLDLYMVQFADNIRNLFRKWPNSPAMIANCSPPSGKPHVDRTAGLYGGLGEYDVGFGRTGLKALESFLGDPMPSKVRPIGETNGKDGSLRTTSRLVSRWLKSGTHLIT